MNVISTMVRTPPKALRTRPYAHSRKAAKLAKDAVRIGTEAWYTEAGPERVALIAKAQARMDWASDREKEWLLRRKRKAQAVARKRARNLRRKSR